MKFIIRPKFVIFCSFLVSIWDHKLAKNHKNLVDEDFQKWFFQKSVLPENFPIKFWTSLKNDLHGRKQFPGFYINFSWFFGHFPVFWGSIEFFEVDFTNFFKFVRSWSRDLANRITSNFLSESSETFCGTQQTAHELLTQKKKFQLSEKINIFISFLNPH